MNDEYDISVVVCTYNRGDLLPDALESVLSQETGGVRYELIVVDNNSRDHTREVVERFINRGHANVRYVFEGEQGLSHARNAGIARARAAVVAFTDDDVRVAGDWVRKIKEAFDQHPEVDLVSGKVLPRWEREPPPWLTRDHWAPIALQDYGDEPFYADAGNPVCLIGANMSIRRDVVSRVGGFDPAFQRIGASSTDDHEWQLRFWRAGKRAMYVPEVIVVAEVQKERLTKAYHRLWHTGHGKSAAMMRLREITGGDGRIIEEPRDAPKLFGVAPHTCRELMAAAARWLNAAARRQESLSLKYENEVRQLTSYIRHQYGEDAAGRRRSHAAEVASFAGAMFRKKLRRRSSGAAG